MLLQGLGLNGKVLAEVSLDIHLLVAYPGFSPRGGHLGRLFPGRLGTCRSQAQNSRCFFDDEPKRRFKAHIKLSVETPWLQH